MADQERFLLSGSRQVPLRGMTAAGQMIEHIRSLVLDEQLDPGDFLGTEAELAKRFGVGRSVVRDALKSLEAMGVVETRTGPGGGSKIAAGNPAYFADVLATQLKLVRITDAEVIAAQLAIECMAAEQAAYFATESDLAHLQALIAKAEQSLGDLEKFSRLSHDFHFAVTAASKNRILAALLASLRYVRDLAYGTFPSRARAEAVLQDHKDLLKIIRQRDGVRARKFMERHLEGLRSRMFRGRPPA